MKTTVQLYVFTGSLIAYIVGAAVGVFLLSRLSLPPRSVPRVRLVGLIGGDLIGVYAHTYHWVGAPIPRSEIWSVVVFPSFAASVVGLVVTVVTWLVFKPSRLG